ncbi:hypothetical protein FHW16_000460 [Phyllobacterium myrsinacearum]|uniref:Uncharacterized protein n=1 Tax=Phyllobacterium myrsinacearum TaxID=28101 RepID=A0A839EED7_9HYPH|nr:hypothetical protein [Phyllobacterium myrsinacearum]
MMHPAQLSLPFQPIEGASEKAIISYWLKAFSSYSD